MSARRRQLASQAGFSLVELLAAMAIGSVVLFALMNIFVQGVRSSMAASDRVQVLQTGRMAMDRMTQLLDSQMCLLVPKPAVPGDVTTVPPIVAGDANSVTIYADENAGRATPDRSPEKYRLAYDPAARTITEYRYNGNGQEPNVTYDAQPNATRVLATSVLPAKDGNVVHPLFSYYGFPPAGSTTAPAVAPPLDAAKALTVVRVDIQFQPVPERTKTADPRHSNNIQGQSVVQTADPGTNTVCP